MWHRHREVILGDAFERWLNFLTVLIVGYQDFPAVVAPQNIAQTTLENISLFEKAGQCKNEVAMEFIEMKKAGNY